MENLYSIQTESPFVLFRPSSPCSYAEAFVQGDPCDTTGTSTVIATAPLPGVVEPTVPHKLPTGDGLPARESATPRRGVGPRGSLQRRTASLAAAKAPVRVRVGSSVETPTVGKGWQSSFFAYSAGAAMNRGRTDTVGAKVDRLCAIDHDILGLLQAHRVLTTPQLITLTARPERTIDYRLARLRSRSLVDRTRPYAASGSAPFYWWLTRAGARLVEGTPPAPGKGTPNPLFLRHTAAIAGLYVALCDVGPNVGLRLTNWLRDEDAWEDWSSYRGTGRLRPDAYAEVQLSVDGHDGVAGAFVEVDFATMDQARLRAKVGRHHQYCKDTIWWDRHPCCPALLLVTTSEARVNRFLASVEKDRPRPSPYEHENAAHYDELVAACAAVASPGEAVVAPVWRATVGDAPVTLSALLSPEVRQYRRVVARVEAAQRQHDE